MRDTASIQHDDKSSMEKVPCTYLHMNFFTPIVVTQQCHSCCCAHKDDLISASATLECVIHTQSSSLKRGQKPSNQIKQEQQLLNKSLPNSQFMHNCLLKRTGTHQMNTTNNKSRRKRERETDRWNISHIWEDNPKNKKWLYRTAFNTKKVYSLKQSFITHTHSKTPIPLSLNQIWNSQALCKSLWKRTTSTLLNNNPLPN
jgi:hypothetical protein